MELEINKLLKDYDSVFFKEKVEIEQNGTVDVHYYGLILNDYFLNSRLEIDYLSIEDYFEKIANVKYCETRSLFEQYSTMDLEVQLKIISAILILVNFATYKEELKDDFIRGAEIFIQKNGFQMEKDDKYIFIKSKKKLFEGSYCDIFSYSQGIYKKQLKDKFKEEQSWKKRFKYEYETMNRLSENPYVLKVFNYDPKNNSYLMEECDCDLFDYLSKNISINDDLLIKIISQIIHGMIGVHDAEIIHRDLHLGNILMKDNKILISDFGLSKDKMIIHSLKSTSTPKNSHFFMDPIGLVNFTNLDKLSDIFSVGRIIDYITRNSELNKKLSYVINKAMDRERTNRYSSLEDMLNDLNDSLKTISEEKKLSIIKENISNGKKSLGVENFILKLSSEKKLSKYIVKEQLRNFAKLLLQFTESNQQIILSSINETYIEGTGYDKFENYEIFGYMMYDYIPKATNIKLQRIAYYVLKGCEGYRYQLTESLEKINMNYPNLAVVYTSFYR